MSSMMGSVTPALGGLILITAGIFQWTPLKYVCINHCRTPALHAAGVLFRLVVCPLGETDNLEYLVDPPSHFFATQAVKATKEP